MKRKRFSKARAFFKGLPVFLGAYAVTAGADILQGLDVSDLVTWKAQLPPLLLSVGLGAVRAGRNAWKNRDLEGSPFYTARVGLPGLCAILSASAVVACSGCATMGEMGAGVPVDPVSGQEIRTDRDLNLARIKLAVAAEALRRVEEHVATLSDGPVRDTLLLYVAQYRITVEELTTQIAAYELPPSTERPFRGFPDP